MQTSIKEIISANLKKNRKNNGFTQKALAEKLGVSHNAISSWESGTNSIDIDMLVQICNLFGLTLNDMYYQQKEKENNDNIEFNYNKDITLNLKEQTLIDNYKKLNAEGQKKLLDYSDDLVSSKKYEIPQEEAIAT